MPITGATISQDCTDQYKQLKARKMQYIICALTKEPLNIFVEKTSTEDNYDEFLNDLPPEDPRYAIYNFEYVHDDGGKREKIVFIHWCPDNSKVQRKVHYAGSKEVLRKILNGVTTEIQTGDASDLAFETVVEKLKRSSN